MTTSRAHRQKTLRTALFANAAFSAASATFALAASGAIGSRMGVEPSLLRSLGLELALFAVALLVLATRPDLGRSGPRAATIGIIALDVGWVVGSAVVLLRPNNLTTAGAWIVFACAIVVADLAFLQALGWRRLRRPAEPALA